MKKLISIFILSSIIFSNSASANDCFQVLSNDFADDSRAFQVADYELESDYEESPALYSIEALDKLYSKIGCIPSVSEKSAVSISCNEIVPGNFYSNVCYVENEYGYFFVSKDMLDSVNIIFNRWD